MADTTSNGLMRLPHFTSSKVSMDKDEPIYTNLFTITLVPPASIANENDQDTLVVLEGIKSISGLNTQPGNGTVSQKYKFAERMFAGPAPSQTHLTLNIAFQLNVRPGVASDENYTYKFLRKWHDLVYDPLTGRMGIKQEYAASSMTITMQDRRGVPYWQWICYNVWPSGQLNGPDLSYDGGNIMEAACQFEADYFDESIL